MLGRHEIMRHWFSSLILWYAGTLQWADFKGNLFFSFSYFHFLTDWLLKWSWLLNCLIEFGALTSAWKLLRSSFKWHWKILKWTSRMLKRMMFYGKNFQGPFGLWTKYLNSFLCPLSISTHQIFSLWRFRVCWRSTDPRPAPTRDVEWAMKRFAHEPSRAWKVFP